MKTEESIHDDERLFMEYFKAIISGRGGTFDSGNSESYAKCAELAVNRHRERFARRVKNA